MKFLYEKDNIIYAKCGSCDRILKFKRFEVGEVKTGVECFCGNVSYIIEGLPEELEDKSGEHKVDISKSIVSNSVIQSCAVSTQRGPICPTCGSRNVSKISLTSKAVGGVMFGLFSSNVRNTFKCDDCGYKW